MKNSNKTPVTLPEGAFVLWATKLAEIISTSTGEAVPVEIQTLIDKLKKGKISEGSFKKHIKKLREKSTD